MNPNLAIRKMNTKRTLGLLGLALAAALTGCNDQATEPFAVAGTGTVEGRLFFDANTNGTFDPVAGDSALSGITVVVRERGTTDDLGSATTDAEGMFEIGELPVGTQDLYVAGELPGGAIVCQNPQPVNIYIGEIANGTTAAREGCRIDIVDAEAKTEGDVVTVAGVVTVAPGPLGGTTSYVQDATGGIQIYGLSSGDFEIGDRIEVTGTLDQFNGELEIVNPSLSSVDEDYGAPAPNVVTTKEVADASTPALTNPLAGTLLQVQAAKLTTGFSSGSATIDDGSGATTLYVASGVADASTIESSFTEGKCYDITGIASMYKGSTELKPRSTSDWKEVPCS